MTFLIILAVVLVGGAVAVTLDEQYDRFLTFLGAMLAAVVIWGLAAILVDWLFYSRGAFAAEVACEAKRQESRRLSFSSDVVCVPAYRATKNDTLQVNGLVKP